MDAFLNKLEGLNYEIFGILMPGFFFLLGLGCLYSVEVFVLGIRNELSEPLNLLWALEDFRFFFFTTVVLVLFSYLPGHILKWVASHGVWQFLPLKPFEKFSFDGLKSCYFLCGVKTTHKQSFNPLFEPLKIAVQGQLSKNAGCATAPDLSNWSVLYVVAKNYILTGQRPSLLNTYQNKYTFHRSLTAAFSLLVWVSAITSAYVGLRFSDWKAVAASLGFGLICFLLIGVFYSSFNYFWRIWGDYIICESYVRLFNDQKV